MPKPFSLQAPETIAKEYAGNKQKIAEAMQMGLLDPTSGVLAGMFIDRMRGAQMQEAAQAPTVAQQVFAPPAPMGGMPMGGLPPAPQMGGAAPPPMGGMPPAPPMGAPPMGMADGGLAGISIPDTMFDEPTNGGFDDGYNGGGIVAFADGGPTNYYGMSTDIGTNIGALRGLYKPETEFSDREAAYIRNILSEEGRKKRRDEDKWFALAQLGATMASTPGSLLQAASAGIGKALPGLQEAAKGRRAEEREAITAGAARELGRNKEQRDLLSTGLSMVEKAGGFAEAAKTREFQDKWQRMDDTTKRYLGQLASRTTIQAGRERSASIADYQNKALETFRNQALVKASDAAKTMLAGNTEYLRLARSKNPTDMKKAADMFSTVRNQLANSMLAERMGSMGTGNYEGFSAEEIGGE